MPDRGFCETLGKLLEKATPAPWQCDVRIGCVAVYPYPERNCLAIGEQFLCYQHGINKNGEWSVPEQAVIDYQTITYLRNHADAILRVVRSAKHVTDASLMGDLGLSDLAALREALAALDNPPTAGKE